MERVLNQLCDKLRAAFSDRLVSVVLYGSAAVGDYTKYSDLNILCVLTRLTPVEMKEAEPIFRWWREQGNPSPVLLTEEEVRNGTDCFAIEFHDMKDRHRILAGTDVIAPLELDDSFYRMQVEHELRAKLLRLRQKAAGLLSDKDHLRRLMVDSVSTFCVLFRHALLLHGVNADPHKREVVARARELFGIDSAPFEKLLDVREERAKPRDFDPVTALPAYMAAISTVAEAVDRLQK